MAAKKKQITPESDSPPPLLQRSRRPPDKEIIEALQKTAGLVTAAANALGVSRSALYNWIREDDKLRGAVWHVRETMKDMAEGKLLEKIKDGDMTAIIFFLKTQAKDRGYIERHEFDGPVEQDKKNFILEIVPEAEVVK